MDGPCVESTSKFGVCSAEEGEEIGWEGRGVLFETGEGRVAGMETDIPADGCRVDSGGGTPEEAGEDETRGTLGVTGVVVLGAGGGGGGGGAVEDDVEEDGLATAEGLARVDTGAGGGISSALEGVAGVLLAAAGGGGGFRSLGLEEEEGEVVEGLLL